MPTIFSRSYGWGDRSIIAEDHVSTGSFPTIRFSEASGAGLNLSSITVSSTSLEYGVSVFMETIKGQAPFNKFRLFTIPRVAIPYAWGSSNSSPVPIDSGQGVSIWAVPFALVEVPQVAEFSILINAGVNITVPTAEVNSIKYASLTSRFDVIGGNPGDGGSPAASTGPVSRVQESRLIK